MAATSTPAATSTVTDYFARVLRRGRLEAVTFQEGSAFIAAPREQVATGALPEEATNALFERHDQDQERSGRKKTLDTSIPVVISLASVPSDRGASQQGILLLEAALDREGRLEVELETGTSPWIPAERLSSPSLTDREVMAGPQKDFWAFALTALGAEISRCETIADAMQLAGTLFTKVSGTSLERFAATHAEAGRHIEHETCYIQEHDRISAVGALLEVYGALGRESEPPPILQRMVGGWDGPRIPESRIHAGDGLLWEARQACGAMNDDHPLTASQRRAVHAFLQSGEGDVTAVSGPPGTGKTTMLQAIVAGLITRRALEQEDAPVIVGTSTNNQAVTNIISSFASVTKTEPGSLDLRWLPQQQDGGASEEPLGSLAAYCPATGKLAEARKHHLVEQKGRSLLYATYSRKDYLEAARDHFLGKVQGFFGGIDTPQRVQGWLHDALTEIDAHRVALLETMSADGPSEEYLTLCAQVERSEHLTDKGALSALRGCTTLEELDATLDVTLRYAEFWLAVHYFEAEWLLAEHLDETERWKSTADVLPRVWPQAAALTPCFVMTLYQLPKYFELYLRPGAPPAYDLGRIDLLIVDEAGQVDTPLGLPALALARRALVVGDEKQLPPVWSLDEETDREMAEGAGIPDDAWRQDLRARGVTCSAPSSLMRAASHASRWSFGDGEPGLLLREHFRCHPDIIGVSNDLLYDGLLEPRRRAESSPLHGVRPALEWVDVPDSKDSRRGASRINLPEAKAIAAWIVEHFASFYDLYHHQQPEPEKKVAEAELIGVVTPFAAQASVISAEIRRAARDADPAAELPTNLAARITVGTAHRLQGAERPIILFSAVYGTGSPQAGFIDMNPQLMNVAVSRAKDLLVVFAAPNRWDNGTVFSVISRFAQRPELDPPEAEDSAPCASASELDRSRPDDGDADRAAAPARTQVPAGQGSLSTVINAWRSADELRAEDSMLRARDLHPRLAAAGIIDGGPGAWKPTRLATLLGVVEVEGTGEDGSVFTFLEYTPRMQELMLQLYRDGHL